MRYFRTEPKILCGASWSNGESIAKELTGRQRLNYHWRHYSSLSAHKQPLALQNSWGYTKGTMVSSQEYTKTIWFII